MRGLKIDTATASAFPQIDRSGLSLRHGGGGNKGFAFEAVPPPPLLQRSTNSQPPQQRGGGFFTDFSLPEQQGGTYFNRTRSEVAAAPSQAGTATFFGTGTTAPANAFGGSTTSAWGLAGASSMAPQTLASPWTNTQPLGTATTGTMTQPQQPPTTLTLFSSPPAPVTQATPGFGSGLFSNTTVWPAAPPASPSLMPSSQPANPWTGGLGGGLQQAPLGLNALGGNVAGGGLSYVGNGGGALGLASAAPLGMGGMAQQQQQAALGGWAAKPQMNFGFTGMGQQQPGPGSMFRPPQTTGLGGAGLFTFGAPMQQQPAQQPIGFNFGGPAQHNLTTGFGSSSLGLPPAPLFGSPPVAQGFMGGGLSSTSAGTTPFSQQPPFDASRGFAWNMESFQKGVTGLSNYEAPISSSWAPPPPRLMGGGNSYGLSNWGRWSGVAPEAGFGRPAEAGRSLLGQWVQPTTLFRHPLVPTAQAGLLTRPSQAILEPQALWGGGMPLGYLGYTHAGIFGYHSLDREMKALQERFRTQQIPLPDKPSPLHADPLLRLVVYRSAPAEPAPVMRREGEEALYWHDDKAVSADEEEEDDGSKGARKRRRQGLHRREDPLANKMIKMIRVAEPY